jgi:hypothetical protein
MKAIILIFVILIGLNSFVFAKNNFAENESNDSFLSNEFSFTNYQTEQQDNPPQTPVTTPAEANSSIIRNWSLSDARPNPAKDHTLIHFTLPEDFLSAQITIRNLVGTIVLNEQIAEGSDRISLNTQDLTNGIYIYSLVINNQTVKSKRLIIAK